MKNTLTLIFTILCLSIFGQQLQFNGQLVDTVLISSHASAYQFDDKGTTKGKANIISIIYNTNQKKYVIDQFYQDKYKRTIHPDTLQLKTKVFKTKIGREMHSGKIKSLLNSFDKGNSDQNPLAGIDTAELKGFLTEKQIRKVAKDLDVSWQFRRRYSSKENNTKFFQGCKSMDTLKLYLSERFNTSLYIMTFDVSNTIDVWISTNKTQYRFEGNYPNPLRQPWQNYGDTSQILGRAILNLGINQSLYKLLPKGFLHKETLSNEAIVNDYITWYFERRKIK